MVDWHGLTESSKVWVLSWIKSLVAFATITIPTWIYAVLSYSMTLTLNFWSFAIMFILSAVALNYWIRFRYLNTYTHLKEPPLQKADAQELNPDVNVPEQTPAFHNYLDEFLQAIRIFGFLEKPVFHELARHLQTRRLIAGDSLSLDQDKSFYCVIDGNVQVFARTGLPPQQHESGVWDGDSMNGYQLLNQVGSGGTLSSLFTILSLFTENVKMSWQDSDSIDDDVQSVDIPLHLAGSPIQTRPRRSNSDVSHLDLTSPRSSARRPSVSSSGSTVHPVDTHPHSGRSGSLNERMFRAQSSSTPSERPAPNVVTDQEGHYSVVARATEDSSLAVIPAEAFRRLTKKFPKATAHIVQVILTRFSRVTFNAAHNYLGLTTEVLRTEKAINDIACHPLPPAFYESGLKQLRQRFDSVSLQDDSDTDSDYFAESVPSQSASSVLGKDAKGRLTDSPTVSYSSPITPFRGQTPRQTVQAGDLHTSTGHSADLARPIIRSFSTIYGSRESLHKREILIAPREERSRRARSLSTDEFDLRDEVMSCIAKSIGLIQPPISGEDSVEASPAFPPSDSRGVFKSSFGSLSLLDIGDDAASSATGASSTVGDGYLSGLDNEVEILFFPAGSVLARAGDRNTGLFYVIEGFLDILLPAGKHSDTEGKSKMTSAGSDGRPVRRQGSEIFTTDHSTAPENSGSKLYSARDPRDYAQKPLFTVRPGGIAGYLSSLCQIASYVDIVAKTDTYVGFLPSTALDRLLEKRPIVLLTLAKRLISLLSPIGKYAMLHIDGSLDWVQVNAGQILWRPDDASDSFYIVINGRLRAITDKANGGISILGEYGQGDTVGELDVIADSPRRSTLHAIRDTELIRMPRTLFNAISSRNPLTTARILEMIASRVRNEFDSTNRGIPSELSRSNVNLKTVAILPVSRNIPVDAFARKLHAALEGIGAPTSFLNQSSVSDHLGRHAFTRMGKLKAAGWLAEQEQRYRLVLYVADSAVSSSWTQTCIRQADCVMVVGMGDDPSIGEYERLLLSLKTTARKELVLLHSDRSVIPGSTRQWLKACRHALLFLTLFLSYFRFGLGSNNISTLSYLLKDIISSIPRATAVHQDPAAVTALRNLRNLVQSELKKYRGGASSPRPQRGQNASDFARLARRLCGKSIGVVLGGGGARGISHLGVLRALEEYGIPIDIVGGTSMGAFVGGLYAREGDIISSAGRTKQFSARMGNFWRLLSDVTYPIVAYTTGHEFNRAIYKAFYDLHIEDMWLPFFCNSTNINTSRMEIHETGFAWRYIRASMTLVGLLPPLCDNGNMLVDGGYIDNLPVSTMMGMGASAVIASDVGSASRYRPVIVSSVKTLEEAKVAPGCLYMGMPVQEFGTLQMGKYEEIQKKGFQAAMDFLSKWDEEGRLPSAYVGDTQTSSTAKTRGKPARRNSI
ncbi:uncharacterized protein FIBRA_05794 [Fibroporia radiculosa]|uniref:Lysophospholipase NTE1 n=1 Tax=Fibroporia radiculosa TaxID=599839 RepID=J4GRM1_9APHY|nr:uncharacterized protein FIBRA_05794 [Fibroporia radiculosa]CCM03650.1 predicted protein [Fibroporia radiculosa]